MRHIRLAVFVLAMAALAISAEAVETLRVLEAVDPDYSGCANSPSSPVVVAVTVAADGSVKNARVVKSVAPCVAVAAARAVRQSRFEPLRTDDAVELRTMVTVPLKRPPAPPMR